MLEMKAKENYVTVTSSFSMLEKYSMARMVNMSKISYMNRVLQSNKLKFLVEQDSLVQNYSFLKLILFQIRKAVSHYISVVTMKTKHTTEKNQNFDPQK